MLLGAVEHLLEAYGALGLGIFLDAFVVLPANADAVPAYLAVIEVLLLSQPAESTLVLARR